MTKMHQGSRLALLVIGVAMMVVFLPGQAGMHWFGAAVGFVLAVLGLVGRTSQRLHEY